MESVRLAACAVGRVDPETATYAPAVSDLHRFPKAGRQVLTQPQEGGKGVLWHGIETDATVNRVAVASTRGDVWVPEERDDDPKPVAGRLPPVSTVRCA